MPIDRANLADAIARMLWRNSKLIPRGKRPNGWPAEIQAYLPVAVTVIEHMEICSDRITKRTPPMVHTSGRGPPP